MKTHKILYQHTGENSDTAKDPQAVYTGQVDLSEQITCCLNWDDNRLVKTDKWAVIEVTLPDWLDPEEWIRNTVDWTWAWGLGMDGEWPETWQRGIAYSIHGEERKLVAIKLLSTKNFKSSFRQSLRNQLVAWLETPAGERVHASPFSPKQWAAATDRWTARDAQRAGSNMYYGYRYSPMRGLAPQAA